MRCIYLTLFLSWLSTMVSAIDILQISHLTDRNGLSQNTVRCMMQDSKGFMWMGTVNGLNRYNGKEFVTIQIRDKSSSTLTDNRIRTIEEDANGYIWVRTFSNTMYCYDPRLELFVDYAPTNKTKLFSGINTLPNGDVWLWGQNGCCRVRLINGKLQSWDPFEGQHRVVSFAFEDSTQRIWLGTDKALFSVFDETVSLVSEGRVFSIKESNGQLFFIAAHQLSVYDSQTASLVKNIQVADGVSLSSHRSCMLNDSLILIATKSDLSVFDTKKHSLSSASVYFRGEHLRNANFITDNKGQVWVYNMSGVLWKYSSNTTFEPIEVIPPSILSLINSERYQIYQDSRDIIWITTFGNGLFALDQKTGKSFHYTAENNLSTNYLYCIAEDRSGELWVGTELAGVAKISLTNYPFEMFYPTPGGNSDRDNAVRLVYEDVDNRYWFGTRDGNLHVCDASLKHLVTHRITRGLPFTMAEDTLGYKWLGTKGGGLLLFPPSGNGKPQHYSLSDKDRQNSSSNNIFTIMRDSRNRMWIASFGGGLHLAERRNGQLVFRQIFLKKETLNMMRSMIQDDTGLIWVGCNEGVVVFDPDKILSDEESYTNLRLDNKDRHSINSNEVRVVFEDSRGRIWLGTTGGGLNLLERKDAVDKSTFTYYGAGNGLSNEMIQAIQEDDEGYIWVSTESGISKFNTETERFENFIFSNKRQSAIFNELSSWKKKNGELMFGSYNGVFIFNPSKITYDTYAPPVILTGLWINGVSMSPNGQDSPLTESITTTDKIVLNHNHNSFNLEFTMMNYHASEFNQYMYVLEGYEKNWNPMSRTNLATYRNVAPGTYLFKVKGCNSFGVWSDKEATLQVIIRPPWWKSVGAICSYILLIAGITYLIVNTVIKMNRLNMAVEVEKQLTEYKLRFFTNISHEFRTPLTIIRGSIEDLIAQKNVPISARKQLNILAKSSARLLRLIDQLLEFRRLQNNKMELNLEPTEANGFFYDIWQTFREVAEKKKIDFLFESPEGEYTLLLDRSKMDKIAYNLLSNALKQTPAGGKILTKLQFSSTDDRFTLSVSDTGPGISKEQQDRLFVRFKQIHYTSDGTGVGLHLTAELAKVHKGTIVYTDSEWGGACFSVTVPLSDKNYDTEDIIHKPSVEKMTTTIEMDLNENENGETELIDVSTEKVFNRYKVVVIEDDEEVRAFIESQLGQYFTVATASNGVEGLERVSEEQPDIVVCDVMMPKMDGYEFTKRLRAKVETSHIPVILLTAYSSEEHRLQGIQSGADSYITKPFSVKYLITRIVKLIEQREKLQQHFASEPGLVQPSIAFTNRDKVFIDKLHNTIEENLSNIDFKIEDFAQSFNMGRSTFFRKLKGITGYPPNEYLRIIRIKKAAELLINTDLNVSEISYRVGINDPLYFSKCFKSQFGKSPSQYRKGDQELTPST